MAEIVRMPRMSDTMVDGTVVEWHKKIGDTVKAGDLLAEIETDKATMEFESYQEGVLLHIGVPQGEAAEVDSILCILGEKGEDVSSILEEEKAKSSAKEEKTEEKAALAPPPTPVSTPTPPSTPPPPVTPQVVAPSNNSGRIKASPLAKKLAQEHNISLENVNGSGDEGRIVKRDIETYIANPPAAVSSKEQTTSITLPTIVGEESYEDVATSQMRKVIARRLGESKFGAPHFYLKSEINMDNVVRSRKALNEFASVKISYNDIIIKAAAVALRQHPAVNASWYGDVIRYNKHIHIGMAVAVDEGLMVPVIKFADSKTLSHISVEARSLAGKARDRKIQPQEMEGSTFSISNLGMMPIDDFTAIINPPNSCILAIGRIKQVPGVVDGEIKPVNVMTVSLSCDHRVVDGMKGAQFLKTFKELLEDPIRLLA